MEEGHARPRCEFSDFSHTRASSGVRERREREVLRQWVRHDSLCSCASPEKVGEGVLGAHGRGGLAAGATHLFCTERKPLFTILYLYVVSMYINREGHPCRPQTTYKCAHGGRAPAAGLPPRAHTLDLTWNRLPSLLPPGGAAATRLAVSARGIRAPDGVSAGRQTPGSRATSATTSSVSQSRPAAPGASLAAEGAARLLTLL